MKKYLIASALPLLFAATACDDEKTDEPAGNAPTIEIGEVTCSETEASVEITPSEDTKTWYWKYAQTTDGGDEEEKEDVQFTSITGNKPVTITMDVEVGKTYTVTAYAENEFGKSKEVTKEFTTPSKEETMTELVELNVKNLTPFTLDVEVTKSSKCSRYVIGAVLDTEDHPFSEEEFIEQAKTSLNPDENYPLQPFNTSEESATFTEQTLVKGTADETCNGIVLGKLEGEKLMVACYAVPADGSEAKLFTKEVEMPANGDYSGTIEAKVDIADEDLTLESAAATISATAPCKMMVSMIEKISGTTFDEKDDDGKTKFIREFVVGSDCKLFSYTEAVREEYKYLQPKSSYQIIVVPIAEDGKIGKVTFQELTTKGPEFNGTGKITSAEISQTTHEYIHLKVNTEGATKVRILSCPDSDFSENWSTKDKLEQAMYEEGTSGVTKDYTVDEIKAGVDLSVLQRAVGKPYRIYGATIDAQGNISEPVNIVKEFTDPGEETYTTITEAVKPEIVFDGTGTLGSYGRYLQNSTPEWDEDGTTFSFELVLPKKPTTCKEIWYFLTGNEGKLDEVEAEAKEKFADYFTDGTVGDGVKKLAVGKTQFSNMMPYDTKWGGSLIVIVTADADNKLKIDKAIRYEGTKDSGKIVATWPAN